uniref:Uncharacterized protein n=1 Tax=Tanacetum cinerariifolium TaxID=118510 RepID=A0A699JVM0_TANCI|nr:hypothetical protein [Tanacetum cinerariifolium]
MLPKSNQTIYDAPDRFVCLYTHSFTLSNLMLPLPKFFCYVLEERERAMDRECKELKLKCEAVMAEFDRNPAVNVLREPATLESNVAALEAEKGKLERRDGYARRKARVLSHLLREMNCFGGGEVRDLWNYCI